MCQNTVFIYETIVMYTQLYKEMLYLFAGLIKLDTVRVVKC